MIGKFIYYVIYFCNVIVILRLKIKRTKIKTKKKIKKNENKKVETNKTNINVRLTCPRHQGHVRTHDNDL